MLSYFSIKNIKDFLVFDLLPNTGEDFRALLLFDSAFSRAVPNSSK